MNFKNISLIFFIYLLFIGTVYSQKNDELKYRTILFPYYNIDSNVLVINVEKDSVRFEGYMVFRYPLNSINILHEDSSFIYLDVYFINNLDSLYDVSKKFFIMPDMLFYLYYVYAEIDAPLDTSVFDSEGNKLCDSRDYKYIRKLYRKYYECRSCDNDNVFLQHWFTTRIFDDSSVTFLNHNGIDSIGYFIFKCSFSAAILKYKSFLVVGTDEYGERLKNHLGLIKVLFPTSPAYYLKPIDKEEYLKKGFNKAEWYPGDLYKK